MKLGTQDPNLYFDAGMIHYRLGDKELSRSYLEQALELNPHFSILYENEARQTLSQPRQGAESSNAIRAAIGAATG